MKKHKKQIIALLIILPVIMLVAVSIWLLSIYGETISHALSGELTETKLKSAGIDECDKLMIVAHPDDDLLWGGAHLQEGGYFVLCLTNGSNQIRAAEFSAMKEAVGCKGIILSYPDKVAGERSDWKYLKNSIKDDLTLILNAREWKTVVTHNPAGEYGHIHHKMTSSLVTAVCEGQQLTENLWYFGQYYRPGKVPQDLEALEETVASQKKDWLKVYESQSETIECFAHMIDHELWTCYSAD